MEWTLSKIMTLILGALVIIAVVVFIFKPSLLEVIKNLPEYSYQYDKEVNMSGLSDAEKAGLCSGDLLIGGINRNLERQGGEKQFIDLYVGSKELETTLYWEGDADNAEIKLSVPGFLKSDTVIGEVKSRQILIYDNYLSLTKEYVAAEKIAKGNFPSVEVLGNLNEAYYVYGNFICRSKESKNQYCERIWDTMRQKTFKLVFKRGCGVKSSTLTDFSGLCLTVTNSFSRTNIANQKWYWSGEPNNQFSKFRPYFIYDNTNGVWHVEMDNSDNGEIIYWRGGSHSCSSPSSVYTCYFADGSQGNGIVTVGEGTCGK